MTIVDSSLYIPVEMIVKNFRRIFHLVTRNSFWHKIILLMWIFYRRVNCRQVKMYPNNLLETRKTVLLMAKNKKKWWHEEYCLYDNMFLFQNRKLSWWSTDIKIRCTAFNYHVSRVSYPAYYFVYLYTSHFWKYLFDIVLRSVTKAGSREIQYDTEIIMIPIQLVFIIIELIYLHSFNLYKGDSAEAGFI